MKLSIYLLRDEIQSFEGLIREKYLRGPEAYVLLEAQEGLPYPCRAYVQANRPKPPKWLSFLSRHFDTAALDMRNQSNSFIIFLRVRGRIFAATFGYGLNALDRSKIEPRFGLLVTLSAVDQRKLSTLDTRTVDVVTRQRRTHLSAAGPPSEFDINQHSDWIRYARGKPPTDQVARSFAGADSLSVNCDCALEELGAKCEQLYALYLSNDYKEKFPDVDRLQPLRRDDSRIAELNAELVGLVNGRSHDRISIAHPELSMTDEEQLEVYRFQSGPVHKDVEEVTLDAVYAFLDEVGAHTVDLDAFHIVGLGVGGDAVTKRFALRDYLVCERRRDGDTFVLSLGDWFQIRTDYVRWVREQVAEIPDQTVSLALPDMVSGEEERIYNGRLATAKGWMLFDRSTFPIPRSYDKVEICDVLSGTRHFLCVKKMESSATLSHLYAQGSVSATLLRIAPDYRAEVSRRAATMWPAMAFDDAGVDAAEIVYAICTEAPGALADSLFFFSALHLLTHVRQIRTVRLKVSLCRVRIV